LYCITIHYPCQEDFERFNQEARAEARLLHRFISYSTYTFRFFSFASLSILWLVATIRRIMSTSSTTINTVKTFPHLELEYSATSAEKMILGETPDLYHLMFGIASLIR
jgi:hypothetical protein